LLEANGGCEEALMGRVRSCWLSGYSYTRSPNLRRVGRKSARHS